MGRTTRTTQPDGTYAVTFYDRLGRVTKSSLHASGGTAFAVTEQLYDLNLNTVTKTYQYADPASQDSFNAGTDPATAYLYTVSGRLTATVDPNGNATGFDYDAFGRRITTTDPANNKSVAIYDNANRLLTQKRLDYDGANHVTFVNAFQYNSLNRVTKSIDQGPDGDITQTTDNLTTVTWFDALGRTTKIQDSAGIQTANLYDSLNRITRTTEDVRVKTFTPDWLR